MPCLWLARVAEYPDGLFGAENNHLSYCNSRVGRRCLPCCRLCKTTYKTVRVRARRNGDDRMPPKLCVGRGMDDLLACCTEQLNLRAARRIFTLEGVPIKDIEDFTTREQEVFVSCGEGFINAKQHREEV